MINDETRALYFKWLENGSVTHSQTQLKAIGNILLATHDEMVLIRKALTEGTAQKETPRPGRQPATTKG